MKRQEFIREIEENLSGKMTAMEIRDVVFDYNEYFDVGIREGKLEEDLCGQWGSPRNTNSRINKATLSVVQNIGETVEKQELDYAPLPNRMIAFFIDTIIAGLPVALLTRAFFAFFIMPFMPIMMLGMAETTMYTSSPGAIQSRVFYGIMAVAFFYLYQPICLFLLRGRTVGKLRDIFAREVLGKLILNTLSFGIASLISFVWALVSKEHKTVHDVIGGTRVMNVPETYQKGQ